MQEPKSYFKNDLTTLYNHDGHLTGFIPDNSIDLVITSPPYYKCEHLWGGIWKSTGIKNFADYNEWLDCFYREWYRMLSPGRYAIVNTCNVNEQEESYNNVAWAAVGLEKAGFMYVDEIIWEKHKATSQRFGVLVQTPYPRMYYPNNVHETWLVYRKGQAVHDRSKWNQGDKLNTSEESIKRFRNDVWHCKTVSAAKVGHVTPFPEEIISDFISMYTFTGETVLEPFAGSGTVGFSASRLGRKSILFDIDQFYCDAMVKKFSEFET